MEGDEPRRCIYVVPRKNRRCKMLVKKGNDFCGEHLVFAQDNDTRLPCPNDPKHSVIKKDLEKHLKRCNSRIVHELPWIVENCNAVVKETKSTEKIDRRPSQEEIDAAIEKIEKCWEKTRDDIRVEIKSVAELEKAVEEAVGADKKKDFAQLSSIIGHARENGLLRDAADHTMVELGAGKGHLTYWMAKIAPRPDYLLVDRSGMRNKYENRAKREDDQLTMTRLRCSVEHFDLAAFPTISKYKSIAMTWKHLCGSGTDAAIRCFANARAKGLPIVGFVIAPCCNHKSRIDEYCGSEFLHEYGLSSAGDFAALRHVATWSNCGLAEEEDGVNFTENEAKLQVGQKAKKILEYGRAHYLRSLGYNCKLVEYIDPAITPENMLIVGTWIAT